MNLEQLNSYSMNSSAAQPHPASASGSSVGVAGDKPVGAQGAGVSIPRVVKFSYHDFRAVEGKWIAVCSKCQKSLSDKSGVTTAFTK